MADNKTDGTLDFGSKTVSMAIDGGSTVTVILDNITPNYPTKVVERTNQLDEPAAQRVYKTFVTASATAQTNGVFVTPLSTFSADLGAGSEAWIVTGVSNAFVKDGETKQNLEIRKTYGTIS